MATRTTNPCDGSVDPCACAPGQDKEIIFNEATCLSASPDLLWDYTQNLLTIDGAIGASGYISSSSQVEGAYIAYQALGSGSLLFTPPSGYGGIVYRGGSMFYYWNNTANQWEEIDFSGDVVSSQINVAHNGSLVGSASTLNFVDSSTFVWSITAAGDIIITSSNAWTGNQNANGYGIINLSTINGVPVNNFLTSLWNQNVNANNFNLTNVGNLGVNGNETVGGNLTVNGTIYYHGQPLDNLLGQDLWTLNGDGSISRNSNVWITGTGTKNTTNNPLTVISTTNVNYLMVDSTGSGAWSALGAEINGAYVGEIGWSSTDVEIWTTSKMIMQGTENNGYAYFPGFVGVRNPNPQFPMDILGTCNASACYYVTGVLFACTNASNQITLNNIASINGQPPGGAQTPWTSNINGGGFSLSNTSSVASGGFDINTIPLAVPNAIGGVDLLNVDNINGAPYPPAVSAGDQTPWLQNINGANFMLSNCSAIGMGTTANAPVASIFILNPSSTGFGLLIQQSNSGTGARLSVVNDLGNVCQFGAMGSTASISPNTFNMNTNMVGYTWDFSNTERFRMTNTGLGVGVVNPSYAIDVSGDINNTSCYRTNGIPFACFNGTGVSLTNISFINGYPPGTGGSNYPGPTNMADVTSQRVMGTNYTNNYGVPMWFIATLDTGHSGETMFMYSNGIQVAWIGGVTSSNLISGMAMVLPGQTYSVQLSSPGDGITEKWVEWW